MRVRSGLSYCTIGSIVITVGDIRRDFEQSGGGRKQWSEHDRTRQNKTD